MVEYTPQEKSNLLEAILVLASSDGLQEMHECHRVAVLLQCLDLATDVGKALRPRIRPMTANQRAAIRAKVNAHFANLMAPEAELAISAA
jgi:hypothetical protein